jgi:Holliday junction DNA helicase RuvA
MIAKLKGIIDTIGDGSVILDVQGVGYIVQCSAKTILQLPEKGQAAALNIETVVREDAFLLYGFLSKQEQDCFKLLLTVQGVGLRVALAILSVLTPAEVVQAISLQDKAIVSRADGVGPKLASRIINELKDKVSNLSMSMSDVVMSSSSVAAATSQNVMVEETISALLNLGYRRQDILPLVQRIAAEQGEETEVSVMIRLSLTQLAKQVA